MLFLAAASLLTTGCSGKYPDLNNPYTLPGTYSYTLTASDGTLTHCYLHTERNFKIGGLPTPETTSRHLIWVGKINITPLPGDKSIGDYDLRTVTVCKIVQIKDLPLKSYN